MTRDDFQFFHPLRVRYSEVDAQGVVFNAHYLTYFDTAITEYFRDLGFDSLNHAQQTGNDFHVVRALVEYKAPIPLDAEIEVGVRAGRIGKSSLSFDLAIFPKRAPDLLASGEIIWVYTNQTSHKSVPIDETLRALITKREKPAAPPL